jgi:hypothetical protein
MTHCPTSPSVDWHLDPIASSTSNPSRRLAGRSSRHPRRATTNPHSGPGIANRSFVHLLLRRPPNTHKASPSQHGREPRVAFVEAGAAVTNRPPDFLRALATVTDSTLRGNPLAMIERIFGNYSHRHRVISTSELLTGRRHVQLEQLTDCGLCPDCTPHRPDEPGPVPR